MHPGGGGKLPQDLKKFKKFCEIGENGDDNHLFPELMSGLSKIISVNIFCGQRTWHGVGAQQTLVSCTSWGGRGGGCTDSLNQVSSLVPLTQWDCSNHNARVGIPANKT